MLFTQDTRLLGCEKLLQSHIGSKFLVKHKYKIHRLFTGQFLAKEGEADVGFADQDKSGGAEGPPGNEQRGFSTPVPQGTLGQEKARREQEVRTKNQGAPGAGERADSGAGAGAGVGSSGQAGRELRAAGRGGPGPGGAGASGRKSYKEALCHRPVTRSMTT